MLERALARSGAEPLRPGREVRKRKSWEEPKLFALGPLSDRLRVGPSGRDWATLRGRVVLAELEKDNGEAPPCSDFSSGRSTEKRKPPRLFGSGLLKSLAVAILRVYAPTAFEDDRPA